MPTPVATMSRRPGVSPHQPCRDRHPLGDHVTTRLPAVTLRTGPRAQEGRVLHHDGLGRRDLVTTVFVPLLADNPPGGLQEVCHPCLCLLACLDYKSAVSFACGGCPALPDYCFRNLFLGVVRGGTGVCGSLTSWRFRGPGCFYLWASTLWRSEVAILVVRHPSHVVARCRSWSVPRVDSTSCLTPLVLQGSFCFHFSLEFLLLWLIRDWLSLLSLVREAQPLRSSGRDSLSQEFVAGLLWSLQAEIRALHDGLKLAEEHGFQLYLVYSDSAILPKTITERPGLILQAVARAIAEIKGHLNIPLDIPDAPTATTDTWVSLACVVYV
ncbi:hypothetical protein Taro_042223 [Colocasia esculenta]|uniref:RNase H type-1 domain-containing protein n=1 Tax=Colocasia esculenta TaxID=4460 RepID=A0A843WNF2_COLES|nr:hypothetical protein [Colocasia esculenta]